jgi:hypothetical protein
MHLTTAFLPGLGFQLVPSERHYLNLNRRYSNRNLLQVSSYNLQGHKDRKIKTGEVLFEFFECIEFYQFLKYV